MSVELLTKHGKVTLPDKGGIACFNEIPEYFVYAGTVKESTGWPKWMPLEVVLLWPVVEGVLTFDGPIIEVKRKDVYWRVATPWSEEGKEAIRQKKMKLLPKRVSKSSTLKYPLGFSGLPEGVVYIKRS